MMRRAALVVSLLIFASSAFAVDRWIPIAGAVGNFRTDSRILNPSGTKDIEVSAYYLPTGALDNAGRVAGTPVKISIAKRSMKVFDDVVTQLFPGSAPLGAILLTSADDFVATSRIYAQIGGNTLGQFSTAQGPGLAITKGVIIQLKSNSAFRTNIGAVNIANATTSVTFNLYDKNNAKIASLTRSFAAYEVLGPSNVTALIPGIPAGTDLSDAWVSFTATNPIFAYGSVIDNGSTDPTFIDAQPDTGSDPTPVESTPKVFDVTLANFSISTNTAGLSALKVGDRVTLRVRATSGSHGFTLIGPDGATLVPDGFYNAGGAPEESTFTVTKTGTYTYFCTNTSCGTGHTNMVGEFRIQ